jgi:hypothetical protein
VSDNPFDELGDIDFTRHPLLAERDRLAALVDAWRPVVAAAVYGPAKELRAAVDALPDEAKP